VVVVVAAGLVAWYEIEARPLGGEGKREVVHVTAGESASTIAGVLEQRGIIGTSTAFELSLLVHGKPTIQPGGYVFHQNQSFSAVRSILAGRADVFVFDLRPGYTLAEVTDQLGAAPGDIGAQFATVAASGAVTSPFEPPGTDNLEGLLGTGEYQVQPGETAEQLLAQMVARFNAQAASAGVDATSAAQLGMTEYQVIIAASIVQKEGYYPQNMGQVARVIVNRLAKGMTLDMTATVLYSLHQDGGTVTTADRHVDTPYNTYLHTGLTPTPICFPSVTALKAAASPTPGSWLYFVVVQKDGTEAFATTYTQQLANQKLAQSRGLG
jgi:UPF0755 protein